MDFGNQTAPESIRRLQTFIRQEYKRLDILVNNAAVYLEGTVSTVNLKMDLLRTTIETNFYGPLMLCQAFVPLMKRRKYGRVVNVSSGVGQMADMGRGYPAYRISKTALNALTLIMAAELQGTNVLVNAMCPGWVRTGMGGRSAPPRLNKGPTRRFGWRRCPMAVHRVVFSGTDNRFRGSRHTPVGEV